MGKFRNRPRSCQRDESSDTLLCVHLYLQGKKGSLGSRAGLSKFRSPHMPVKLLCNFFPFLRTLIIYYFQHTKHTGNFKWKCLQFAVLTCNCAGGSGVNYLREFFNKWENFNSVNWSGSWSMNKKNSSLKDVLHLLQHVVHAYQAPFIARALSGKTDVIKFRISKQGLKINWK